MAGLVTVRAGVGGAARLDLARPDPQQMTLVLEHAPELASHRGSVAPVAEASAHASPTSFGLERRQIFATDEPTVRQQGQQDEQVGGQVGQFAVAPFILLPALLDACVIGTHPFLPASEMSRQRVCLLLVCEPAPA